MKTYKVIASVRIEAEDDNKLSKLFKREYPDFEIRSIQEVKEIKYDK